jgi:osmotically-inducible protein OsmY
MQDTIEKQLAATGYTALRRIECRVDDGVVELVGKVPSYYLKQVAQAAVLRLVDIREVRNRLVVAGTM